MKRPTDGYVKSEIKYEPEDVLIVYGKGYKSRMVNDRGFCNYKGKRFFVGNPFAGYNVGIKEYEGETEIWFDDFQIGTVDKITGLIILKQMIKRYRKHNSVTDVSVHFRYLYLRVVPQT